LLSTACELCNNAGFLEKPNINPPDIAQVLDVFRRYDDIFSLFEALAKFGKQK
jgi:hypothetical protein